MDPTDRRYSKEHEWAKLEGDNQALVGLTQYAQDQLGDVVYVDLPKLGTKLAQFQKMGEVESVKAVSDLYSPTTGTVVEVNETLAEHPELVNEDPYGKGWMVRVELENASEIDQLLTSEQYQAFLQESGQG